MAKCGLSVCGLAGPPLWLPACTMYSVLTTTQMPAPGKIEIPVARTAELEQFERFTARAESTQKGPANTKAGRGEKEERLWTCQAGRRSRGIVTPVLAHPTIRHSVKVLGSHGGSGGSMIWGLQRQS